MLGTHTEQTGYLVRQTPVVRNSTGVNRDRGPSVWEHIREGVLVPGEYWLLFAQ